MSPTQISEVLFAFIICVLVGLVPGLICGFAFLGRRVFHNLLWNTTNLMTLAEDAMLVFGTVWPFVLFPLAASWLDSQLQYYFPYGGFQPGWLRMSFAAFPYLLTLVFIVLFVITLPLTMRLDRAHAERQHAERYY